MNLDQPFLVEALDLDLPRSGFHSGQAALDRYFHEQLGQDMRRNVTACFAARTREGDWAGYYTLASASVAITDLPEALTRKLPRYPTIPAVLVGRLAVDRKHQGVGLGGALVVDALKRCLKSQIAAYALVVDAADGGAVGFYAHLGFLAFPTTSNRLFLQMATARKIVSK